MATEITLADAPGEAPTPTAEPAPSRALARRAAARRPRRPSRRASCDIAWFARDRGRQGARHRARRRRASPTPSSPRYQGKGMKLRAVGYTGGLMVVPVAWRLLGRKDPYPARARPRRHAAAARRRRRQRRRDLPAGARRRRDPLRERGAAHVGRRGARVAADEDLVGGGRHRDGRRHLRGRGLGDRRVGRAQARREGHEPQLRRHHGRPHRDDRRRGARRARDAAAPPGPPAPAARAAAPTSWSPTGRPRR